VDFELVGKLRNIETIAAGGQIRELERLVKVYGKGHWRKLKGFATVRLADGAIRYAEVHWYEAHGMGRRDLKLKLPFLD